MKSCLMEDEWIHEYCQDMPEVVSILDEGKFVKVLSWIEEATYCMEKDGFEEFSAIDPAVHAASSE